MKTYKSVLFVNTALYWGAVTNIDSAQYYTPMNWIEIDREGLPERMYAEFIETFFRNNNWNNPSTLELIKIGFDAFKKSKLQEIEEEHQKTLARKRGGQKYLCALVLSPSGKRLQVMDQYEAYRNSTKYGCVIVDQYNYPNHYYRAFTEYINTVTGGLYQNPKTPEEIEFLFQVFQTDFADYAAYKKQQRLQEKLAQQEAEPA